MSIRNYVAASQSDFKHVDRKLTNASSKFFKPYRSENDLSDAFIAPFASIAKSIVDLIKLVLQAGTLIAAAFMGDDVDALGQALIYRVGSCVLNAVNAMVELFSFVSRGGATFGNGGYQTGTQSAFSSLTDWYNSTAAGLSDCFNCNL